MTRQQLLKYVTSPETLNTDTVSKLEALIRKYPFFSIAQILHLKNLQNINDERFEEALKHTAVSSANRVRLKDILFNKSEVIITKHKEIKYN